LQNLVGFLEGVKGKMEESNFGMVEEFGNSTMEEGKNGMMEC